MTQDDYRLWTGDTITFEDGDWCEIVQVASGRLASFLCLEALPEPLPGDLAELLAEFICGVLARRGGQAQIESKSVRNFTIRFRSGEAANAFAQIANGYGDIITRYSSCGSGIAIERTVRHHYDGCV